MKKISIIKSASFIMLALALTLSLVCFTGCDFAGSGNNAERNEFIDGIGGVSETFKGAVSEESYGSSAEAAQAYIAEEVVGEKDAEILATESKGELSSKEIAALNIPAEFSEGINAVELIEVEYTVADSSLEGKSMFTNLSDKPALNKTQKVKVYVIKYATEWKYFAPMPVTGETISKSYYDSVFDSEKYMNCTFESTSSIIIKMDMSGQGQKQSYDITMDTTQTIKFAGNKVYLEQKIVSTDTTTGQNSNNTICAYLEEDENGRLSCYVQTDGGDWYEGSLTAIGFTSLEQLTPFYDQYLDYTYFTKADFGFKLSDENAAAYLEQALDSVAGGMLDIGDMDIDMYAEYYVSEGVLSGLRMNADIGMNMNEGGISFVVDEQVTNISKCTNYGTTVVEKPFAD